MFRLRLFSNRVLRTVFRTKIECFVLLAVLKLSLGMAGAATVSVTNAALPDWLPGQHAQQLFYVRVPAGPPHGAPNSGGSDTSFSLPAFEALRGDRRAFSDVMAYVPLSKDKVTVHARHGAEEATGEMVSGNFFSGLGVKMRLGDGFKLEDEERHSPVVVLSFAYWTHLYSRDPDVAGRTIYIEGIPFAVLGVTGEGFTGVEPGRPTDFWMVLQNRRELTPWGASPTEQTLYGSPNWWCLRLIARLAPGMNAERAVAEATPAFQTATYASLGAQSAEDPKVTLSLVPATGIQGLRNGYSEAMLVWMALAMLLLIACGYVALRIMRSRAARSATQT